MKQTIDLRNTVTQLLDFDVTFGQLLRFNFEMPLQIGQLLSFNFEMPLQFGNLQLDFGFILG